MILEAEKSKRADTDFLFVFGESLMMLQLMVEGQGATSEGTWEPALLYYICAVAFNPGLWKQELSWMKKALAHPGDFCLHDRNYSYFTLPPTLGTRSHHVFWWVQAIFKASQTVTFSKACYMYGNKWRITNQRIKAFYSKRVIARGRLPSLAFIRAKGRQRTGKGVSKLSLEAANYGEAAGRWSCSQKHKRNWLVLSVWFL